MNTSNIQIYDNLDNVKDKKYDITTIFLMYNPKLEDVLISLRSLIKQVGIKHQIIVCDDGSKENYFNEIKKLFDKNSFNDYKILNKKNNEGTVKNVKTGLDLADGEYIKLLSPGDCLSVSDALYKWVKALKNSNCKWSFCNPIYYYRDEFNNPKIKFSISSPMFIRPYVNNNHYKYSWNMIAYADIVNGASCICEKSVINEYIDSIENKIILCEDIIYKLLVCNREYPLFYNDYFILYDKKSGLSNSGNSKTLSLVKNDSMQTMGILEKLLTRDSSDLKLLDAYKKMENRKNNKRLIRIMFRIFTVLKNFEFPKTTPLFLKRSYKDLLEYKDLQN